MQLKQFMQDKTPEEAIWTSPKTVLIRETPSNTVACPWAETADHPTGNVEPADGVPPCRHCPFYGFHERASQGTDGQTPWVGVLCSYDGTDPR